jgi:hypothetical protein
MRDLNSMSMEELEELLLKGEEEEQYRASKFEQRQRALDAAAGKFSKVIAGITTMTLLLIVGCSSKVECLIPSNLPTVTYCLGKIAGDGQEALFRDAWVDGKPAVTNYSGGDTLWGQALRGVAGDAALAGGAVGAALLLKPPTARINANTDVGLNNTQTSNTNNTNENHSTTKVGDIVNGGNGGGVPGCQKAKFGC